MDAKLAALVIKKGREKPILNRHPWIFSGAVGRIEGQPNPGDIVEVVDSKGAFLARAYYNPHSQINGRILTWNSSETIDDAFWQRKIERALAGRAALALEPQTTAYRLINAESDGLPGLIVDKYADFLVMQCLTLGIDGRKQTLINLLAGILYPAGIVERSDVSVRRQEGLDEVKGTVWGQEPPAELLVQENGHMFGVDLLGGHKTGLYLDQRDNRTAVCQPQFVAGKEILNVFAYTGGFALYAAANGAGPIVNIDSSVEALTLAEQNVIRDVGKRPSDEYIAGDAFEVLRYYRDEGRQFDAVSYTHLTLPTKRIV